MNGTGFPRRVVVRLQSDIKLTIEKTGGIRTVIVAAQLRAHDRNLRVLGEQVAHFRGELARFFKRDGVGHGSADPQSAFVEVRKKFAADERDEEKSGGKDEGADEQGHSRMIEAPFKTRGVSVADPFEDAI